MLQALAALVAVTGLAVAVRPGARAQVVAVVVGVSVVSIGASTAALFGYGRTRGALSMVESLALLGLVFLALRHAPGRTRVGATGVSVAAGLLIVPSHVTSSDSLGANVAGMAVFAAGALAAAGVARYLDVLEVRRARSVAEAEREQRLALARDLHDFVAHDVSAIVVQAQAAQVVSGRAPDETLAALERIEAAGLRALTVMDRAVEALRDAGTIAPGGLQDLGALVERFEAAGPARVKFELGPGIAERVAPETSRAAYRIVSEALTNVCRHAPDVSRVQVSVGGSPTALAIAVANDGVAGDPTPARRGGGSGLSELREHSEALGGTLEAGPDGHGGWRLDAVLPT